MNKAELITQMAEKAEVSKKDAEKLLGAFIDTVTETVKNDEKVQLVGFGTFELRKRDARNGRDPRTGNAITIQASNSPAFKPGKVFKDIVNNR